MDDNIENNKFIINELKLFKRELGIQLQEVIEIERMKSLSGDVKIDTTLSDKLKVGIKLFEENRFSSLDDVQSVKYLMELEIFFKTNLKDYHYFIEYRQWVRDVVFVHAEIEVRLDELEKKAKELYDRNYQKEADELMEIVVTIRASNDKYFTGKIFDYQAYRKQSLDYIHKNSSFIRKNECCNKLLVNLMALILTGGIAFLVNKAINGKFLFFDNTDTEKNVTNYNRVDAYRNSI